MVACVPLLKGREVTNLLKVHAFCSLSKRKADYAYIRENTFQMTCRAALLLSLIISLAFIGCEKDKCINGSLRLTLQKFDSTELETVIIRKYAKTSDFTTQIDVQEFRLSQKSGPIVPYDTVHGYIDWVYFYPMNSQYDYIVEVPNANKTFSITEIDQPQNTIKQPLLAENKMCWNGYAGCKVNGEFVSLGGAGISYGQTNSPQQLTIEND